MELGKTIISLRKQQGLSQKELADMAGISANALCSIEKNNSFPSKETIAAICFALQISTGYMLLRSLTDEDIPEEKLPVFKVLYKPMLELFEKEN